MKLIVIYILSFIFFTHAFAGEGGHVGNGGDGVEIGSHYYLLDLVEAAIEKRAALDLQKFEELPQYLDNANTREIKMVFSKLTFQEPVSDPKIAKGILSLLLRVRLMDALAIMGGIQAFSWRMVDSDLQKLNDDENSSLDIKKLKVKQLAIRRDRSILINRTIFDQMDTANQVALIFHEVFYAYLKPVKNGDFEVQNSWQAREVVGALFTGLLDHSKTFNLDDYLVDNESIFSFGDLATMYQASPIRGFLNTNVTTHTAHFDIDFDPRLSLEARNQNYIRIYGSDLSKDSVVKKSNHVCATNFRFDGDVPQLRIRKTYNRVQVRFKSYQGPLGVSQRLILSPQMLTNGPEPITVPIHPIAAEIDPNEDCKHVLTETITNTQIEFNNEFYL